MIKVVLGEHFDVKCKAVFGRKNFPDKTSPKTGSFFL